jgi:hypothetical protein
MDTTASSAASQTETAGLRFRNFAIGALFAIVLLVPKLLRLRRDERAWTAFRILLGISGAALVILPLSLWNSWLAAIAGLAMFLASILLPAPIVGTLVDDKARELGALVVVNGGEIQPPNAPAAALRLFVGADNIWALDSRFQPLLIIAVVEISSVSTQEVQGGWLVRVPCSNQVAEFFYRGIFAEHLARVAESTIRSVMRTPLPVLPRSRAAGA